MIPFSLHLNVVFPAEDSHHAYDNVQCMFVILLSTGIQRTARYRHCPVVPENKPNSEDVYSKKGVINIFKKCHVFIVLMFLV